MDTVCIACSEITSLNIEIQTIEFVALRKNFVLCIYDIVFPSLTQ